MDSRSSYYQYISGITQKSHAIFLNGQAKGNRANVFSKVGDSISYAMEYLIPIGLGRANFYQYDYLIPTVRYFGIALARDSNSFANRSLAVGNGWNAWTVLDTNYSDKQVCHQSESPLKCEYRIVKPSMALIMLGTNDVVNSDPARFRSDLSRIVESSIEMGVIPVLSTIPERMQGDVPPSRIHDFNAIIVQVARLYEVPLWDYWLSMKNLPNNGIGDGVHPSIPPNGNAADFSEENLKYGYTVRNLGALHVLNALWGQAMFFEK